MPATRLTLAFGNNHLAVSDTSIRTLNENVAGVITGCWDVAAISDEPFLQKSCTITLGKLNMAALASTAIHVRRGPVDYTTLLFPFQRTARHSTRNGEFIENTGKTAVLIAEERRETITQSRFSGLRAMLDHGSLARVSRAMLGIDADNQPVNFALDCDRELSLKMGGLSLDLLLRQNLSMLDQLTGVGDHALTIFNLEDQFYRLFACLLAPDALFDPKARRKNKPRKRSINHICNYIAAHAATPITLTRLEEVSGMSRRMLQYEFLKRFGCTPMTWVREYRMDLARKHLQSTETDDTVTEIALKYGFSHLSRFAHQYREKFGETPSETRSRIINP